MKVLLDFAVSIAGNFGCFTWFSPSEIETSRFVVVSVYLRKFKEKQKCETGFEDKVRRRIVFIPPWEVGSRFGWDFVRLFYEFSKRVCSAVPPLFYLACAKLAVFLSTNRTFNNNGQTQAKSGGGVLRRDFLSVPFVSLRQWLQSYMRHSSAEFIREKK